jgi:hypothetical protein
MKVKVYRNLRPTKEVKAALGDKPIFSVKAKNSLTKRWRVVDRVTEITLIDPVFIVSEKGNERVRKEGRKNVHAEIHGTRMSGCDKDAQKSKNENSEWYRITYNPYKHRDFVLADDESKAVRSAIIATIIEGEGVWVFKPTLEKV